MCMYYCYNFWRTTSLIHIDRLLSFATTLYVLFFQLPISTCQYSSIYSKLNHINLEHHSKIWGQDHITPLWQIHLSEPGSTSAYTCEPCIFRLAVCPFPLVWMELQDAKTWPTYLDFTVYLVTGNGAVHLETALSVGSPGVRLSTVV